MSPIIYAPHDNKVANFRPVGHDQEIKQEGQMKEELHRQLALHYFNSNQNTPPDIKYPPPRHNNSPTPMDRGTVHVTAPSLHAHPHMTALSTPSLPQRSPFGIQELLGLGTQSESTTPTSHTSFSGGSALAANPHLLYSHARHAAALTAHQSSLFHDSRHVWMNPALLPAISGSMGGLGGGVNHVAMGGGVSSMLGLRPEPHTTIGPPDAHSPGKPFTF